MNPGASATSTVTFPAAWASARAASTTAGSVCGVRTISTRGITATGLKKWMPTSRSGRARPSAIAVTDSADVLVARMASGDRCGSTSANTARFTSISSNTASMTSWASAKPS